VTALKADNLACSIGRRMIVSGIDLDVQPGTMTALVGVNGVGKSTLMRVLAGIRPATTGHVEVDGRDLSRLRPRERARLMAFVAQEEAAPEDLSLSEMVALGRLPHLMPWQVGGSNEKRIVAECLDEGAGDRGGVGVGARWARAERAVARLREHFAPFRFSDDVDYGLLAIPASNRLDTRGAMDLGIRRGQQPDLAEDFVDPALGEGVDLAGSAGAGGSTLAKDGWMVVAGVVGQYGISAGSHEDITAAAELQQHIELLVRLRYPPLARTSRVGGPAVSQGPAGSQIMMNNTPRRALWTGE